MITRQVVSAGGAGRSDGGSVRRGPYLRSRRGVNGDSTAGAAGVFWGMASSSIRACGADHSSWSTVVNIGQTWSAVNAKRTAAERNLAWPWDRIRIALWSAVFEDGQEGSLICASPERSLRCVSASA